MLENIGFVDPGGVSLLLTADFDIGATDEERAADKEEL